MLANNGPIIALITASPEAAQPIGFELACSVVAMCIIYHPHHHHHFLVLLYLTVQQTTAQLDGNIIVFAVGALLILIFHNSPETLNISEYQNLPFKKR